MKLYVVVLLIFLGTTSVYGAVCNDPYNQIRCCKGNIEGVGGLDCETLDPEPNSVEEFGNACTALGDGRTPKCCVVGAGGIALLCQNPGGF